MTSSDQKTTLSVRSWVETGFLAVLSLTMAATGAVAIGYGLWRDGLPDAGLYPAAVAFLCAVLAAADALRTAFGPQVEMEVVDSDSEELDWSVEGILWRKLALYALSFIVLVLTFDLLGFFAASGLATMTMMVLAERAGLIRSLLVTVGLLLLSYLIFAVLLGVNFPAAAILKFWNL